jgi:O-antigen ligase
VIRLTALWLFILALIIYAWRDWYRALCGLILLMAVIQHPDMPKSLFGIQGLNPWNIVFLVVVMAWLLGRHLEGLRWDLPAHVSVMLLLYLTVVVVSFRRMIVDTGSIVEPQSIAGLWSEHLVNAIKWTIPGLLLFDGARSRGRFMLGFACTLGLYVFIGIQVIKWMPPGTVLSGAELGERSLKILVNEVGYHRVNLSMMLGGASWALFAAHVLPRVRFLRVGLLGLSLAMLYAQALTGGRTGYATWFVVGLVLCILRWRRYLLLVPVALAAVLLFVPGAAERLMQGFTPETHDLRSRKIASSGGAVDEYTITAGRNVAWPLVIAKIREEPLFGYGTMAMQRTGIAMFLYKEYGEIFPHPHNAYLEMLLDNGIVGFVLVMPFYAMALGRSMSLLRDRRSLVFVAVGGASTALLSALLVASIGSQTFYPREGALGMWCAIGLMLRVWVERRRAVERLHAAAPASPEPAAGGSFSSRLRAPRRVVSLDPYLWPEAPER